MKFEKHLKSSGINGAIYEASNGTLFLRNGVFGNVLVRIPEGCVPLSSVTNRSLDRWMNALVLNGNVESRASLASAIIEADGAPKDIKRIYRDVLYDGAYGDKMCMINQDAYTLIERYDDVRIFTPYADPVQDGVEREIPVLVILDKHEETIGIILGE